MKRIETGIDGLFVVEPEVFGDHRGWFMESWSKRKFEEIGIDCEFVQDNHSFSEKKGTLRGLHFQKGEYAQAKLVRVLRGRVYDVAVDLRKNSPTFLKWFGVELSEENKKENIKMDYVTNLVNLSLFFEHQKGSIGHLILLPFSSFI